MDRLRTFPVILLGVVSSSQDWISGLVLERTVRPGDNITLYCDCKTSSGVHIVWYRNCSHENQPSLVLKQTPDSWSQSRDATGFLNLPPHFHFVRNNSSKSYDLLILNITDSDEGLYYCGTQQFKVDDEQYITSRYDYRYGNITTKIILDSSDSSPCPDSSDVSWMIMLTPAFTLLFSFISFIFVCHLCQKTGPQVHQKTPDTRGQARHNQGEDVFLTRVVFRAQDG